MNQSETRLFSEMGAAKLAEISENSAVYADFLKFQGRVYKQSATVALEFFAQRPAGDGRPDVQFIANEKQWAAAGYKIKRGGEAIHFVDENGNRNDLFDFSQVEGNLAPRLWTINNENADEFKSALGIPKESPIIKSLIEQTIPKSSVIECMEALEIPPQEFEQFNVSYYNAVQTIIAGRFEIGGNKFNITPDMTAFQALDDSRKMHFLSMVSNAARTSLKKVEMIANEIAHGRSEPNETKLSAVGKSHTRTAEQHTGEQSSRNTASGIAKRTDNVANDNQGQRESLGDSSGRTDGALSGVQAEGSVGTESVVQVQPDVGVLQHEPDERGTVNGGGTNRDLRDSVDGVHESTAPALGGRNAAQENLPDGGEVGGQNSVGIQRTVGETVPESSPLPEHLRGEREVSRHEKLPRRWGGHARESADNEDSRITAKLNKVLEAPSEQGGVSSRSRKKIDPNQLTLFGDDVVDNSDDYTPTVKTAPTPIPQNVIDNILSHGGNNSNSILRIIAQFQKGKDVSENADFLQSEFTGRMNGDVLGRGHIVDNRKYAVWFDNAEGIKIGRGDSATIPQAVITWEQAAVRIGELLAQGTFATQENLDKAWDYEVKDCAIQTLDLNRECEDGYEFFPIELKSSGFPDMSEEVTEHFKNPETLQQIIDSLSDFTKLYEQDRDIVRFHFYNPHKILGELQDLQLTPTRFAADPAFSLQSQLFITEDEKNLLVESGHHLHVEKAKVAEFFRSKHTSSEQEKFLKSSYSTHSGSHNGGYSSECGAKGLTLTRKFQYKFGHDVHAYDEYDKVLMNWKDVATRISAAIRAGTYVAEKAEKPVVENINEKPTIPVNISKSPVPVFFIDWKAAQLDFDMNLYNDGDIIGYDVKGVEHKVGKMKRDNPDLPPLTYVTQTGVAVFGSNEVPGDIYEQITAFNEGEITEEQVRENYLAYLEAYKSAKEASVAVETPTPEKQYDLGYGSLGNGLTVWNRANEVDGDYETVAHIQPDGEVSIYDKALPSDVRESIAKVAQREALEFIERKQKNSELTIKNKCSTQLLLMFGKETAEELRKAFNESRQADFIGHLMKERKIKKALYAVFGNDEVSDAKLEKAYDLLVTEHKALEGLQHQKLNLTPEDSVRRFIVDEYTAYVVSKSLTKQNVPHLVAEYDIGGFERLIIINDKDTRQCEKAIERANTEREERNNARLKVLKGDTPVEEIAADIERVLGLDDDYEPPFTLEDMFFIDSENNHVLWDTFTERVDGSSEFIESVLGYDEILSAIKYAHEYPKDGYSLEDTFFRRLLENASLRHYKNDSEQFAEIAERYRTVTPDFESQSEAVMTGLIAFAEETEQKVWAEVTRSVILADLNPELVSEHGEETAMRLHTAFNTSVEDGYEDNVVKQRLIKRALYDVVGNEDDTEKAFTALTGIESTEPETHQKDELTAEGELPAVAHRSEIVYAESPNDKFWDNLAALCELKRIEGAIEHGREPFDNKYNKREDSEQRLAKYSGWGGLPQVFDKSNTAWERQRSQLQMLLTEDEYSQARETTLNAHYTPQIIIDSMYEAIKNMDLPRNARILEPSCGTGNFIRRLPAAFGEASVTGVEIDDLTARIAKYLNPEARIIATGFESAGLDNNDFDLICGNIPFGNYTLNDPDYTQDWLIHDAFFRKALDKVAPGGVVAFVTSSGTLDKQNPRVREYLAKQAELIGAIRLPNNAFKDAGTKVTADIIFLQKRKTPLLPYEESPAWCYTTPNADGLKINSYFVNNPQMILGKMEQTTHFDMLTCKPFEGADLKQQLTTAIGNLNAKITVEKREKAAKERAGTAQVDADSRVKNFAFGEIDGKFFYRKGDKMDEIKATPQLRALCDIRTVMRQLLNEQKTDIPDEMLISSRTELNRLYDNYVARYGVINSSAARNTFGKDTDYPLLQGLERHNEDTQKWEKADIFFKRTVNAVVEITGAETVEEALQISLDRKGKPVVEYMAELLERDCESVCAELLEKQLCFRDTDKQIPDEPYYGIVERSEYLSGNVRYKLIAAEANMVGSADSNVGIAYRRNVEALQKVIPEDIKAENIAVRMGVPWIEENDYSKFLKHLAGRNGYTSNGDVTYSPVTGEFEVSGAKKRDKSGLNVNESTTYGTKDFSLYALAEKSLNQRQIIVKVERPHPTEPDKTVMKTDHKATKLALEKARLIKDEFKKWIFADPDRRNKYERKYNDIFNCLVGREYDGSKLTFSGMATTFNGKDFIMREHQKNAVARASMGGNALIAHVVGAGKSAVIFASVMRKKELGLIDKACVVVPKALTEQIAKEWRSLYPEARILTVSNDDLSSEAKRKLFTAKVATGSYDGVILSREQFEKIPMSRQHRVSFMMKELDAVEDMLRERKRDGKGKGDPSTKQLELAKKRMRARLDKLTDPKAASKAKDDLLEFEQLGFDYLVVDECHAYKNGFVMTKMTNVAGVTTRESGRAADMQMKTDYFNEQLGDGHLMMLSGTPVSNSMTELFVMTRYLRPDLLRQAGISRFDDWASVFGNVTTALEQTAYDTYKLKTRFSEFSNLPELMAFYKEFADIKSAEKLDLPRPSLKNGKNTIVNVPATPEQKAYVKELGERAEAINQGNVPPNEDNYLKITGEARLIGLGNQAVKALYERSDRPLPPEFVDGMKNGKVDACIEKVFERWEQSAECKGVQLVFSDVAVNSENGNFSAYQYIRDELIEKGIPEEQIIFAPKSDSKDREDIFKKINSGEYRVIIASTETLGTGANIQTRLVALHHLDVPWKPSCLQQREGRILRQGNENPEVEILNYVTGSTLDSYLYSTVCNKARFIAQILDNDSPARVCEDLDETVLTYAEIQAVAAGNPDIKLRIETANSLAEYNMLRREWGLEKARMREHLEVLPAKLETAKDNLAKIKTDKEGAAKVAEMEELPFDNKRLHAEINRAVANFKKGEVDPITIGTVGGFSVTVKADEVVNGLSLENYSSEIVAKIIVKGSMEYSCEAGRGENDNNVVRLKNVFASIIPKREESAASEVTRLTENLEQAQSRINVPFEYEAKLVELEKLLIEVDERLSGIKQQEDVSCDDDDLEPETVKEKSEHKEVRSAEVDDDDTPEPPRKGRVA